jgi:hypothetical protein
MLHASQNVSSSLHHVFLVRKDPEASPVIPASQETLETPEFRVVQVERFHLKTPSFTSFQAKTGCRVNLAISDLQESRVRPVPLARRVTRVS